MEIESKCILCGSAEKNSQNLSVCSSCIAKFSSYSAEKLEEFAEQNDLTEKQCKFLGVWKNFRKEQEARHERRAL